MKNNQELELDENQAGWSWGDFALMALLIGMLFSIIIGAVFRFILLAIGVTFLAEKASLGYNKLSVIAQRIRQ